MLKQRKQFKKAFTPTTNRKRLVRGFTMVEIIVAIGVLAIGVVGVSFFFAHSVSITRSSSNISVASNLAQGIIDGEMVKSYNELTPQTGTETPFSTDPSNAFYNFSKTVSVSLIDQNLANSASDVGLKKIDVIVSWHEGSVEKSLELATIKANE